MPFRPIATAGLTEIAQRRRLRTVDSLQMLAASPRRLLDDIAEVAGRTVRSDFATILLQSETGFAVIGGNGFEGRHLPVLPRCAIDWDEDGIAEHHDLTADLLMTGHPFVNGTADRIVSTLCAPIRHDGQIVGLIGTASRRPVGSYSPAEHMILKRLSHVTESAIQSEVTLARLAAEAFRALERCRILLGQPS